MARDRPAPYGKGSNLGLARDRPAPYENPSVASRPGGLSYRRESRPGGLSYRSAAPPV